jgi:hypothetical protein
MGCFLFVAERTHPETHWPDSVRELTGFPKLKFCLGVQSNNSQQEGLPRELFDRTGLQDEGFGDS